MAQYDNAIAAPFKSRFNRVCQSHTNAITDDQPIDHGFNRVPLAFLQPDRFGAIQFDHLSVDPRTNESFTPEFFEHVSELTGLILNQRRQHNDFAARFVRHYLIDDLLRRLAAERPAGERIMRLTHCGKEDPQVIVDLSRGRDCRSWIRASAASLDGDGRRQVFDEIDIRLFHLIQELPRVSGKALDVTALPFGIKRVESERGFPRAA